MTPPTARRTGLRLPLAGALYFGATALAVCGLPTAPHPFVLLLALPLAGAVGGGGLAGHSVGRDAVPRAALGFSLGLTLGALLIGFSLISLQEESSPAWGATAWGLGFALGGTFGGLSLGQRPGPTSLAAAISFGLAGALGGAVAFSLFSTLSLRAIALGLILALTLGGTLLGAFLDRPVKLTPVDPYPTPDA